MPQGYDFKNALQAPTTINNEITITLIDSECNFSMMALAEKPGDSSEKKKAYSAEIF